MTTEGRAYLYLGNAAGLATTPAWTADPTDQIGAKFGSSVSAAGDVNGDGFAEALVGASSWDGPPLGEGRAYLFAGTANGLATTSFWTVDPSDQASAGFGASVSGAGDVNNDGFADVVVGARRWDGMGADEGRAYCYLGSATGLTAPAAWLADPTDQLNARFGGSVSGAGDVNGDGFGDVLVGADGWDGEASDEGRAYLYLGTSTGLSTTAAWVSDPTDQTGAGFGNSVSGAGDVNGDGFADVIVGAGRWGLSPGLEGRAYLYLGSATGLSTTPAWTADPTNQANAFFGGSVSGAGDVNGDGFGDVVVGAEAWDGVAMDEGRAYVSLGGDTNLPGLGTGLGQFRANGSTRIALGNGAGGDDVVNGGGGFNQIVINGSNAPETFVIGQNSGRIAVTRGSATITAENNMSVQGVTVNALGGSDNITVQDLSAIAYSVLVVVNGGDGNDVLTAQGSSLGFERGGRSGTVRADLRQPTPARVPRTRDQGQSGRRTGGDGPGPVPANDWREPRPDGSVALGAGHELPPSASQRSFQEPGRAGRGVGVGPK